MKIRTGFVSNSSSGSYVVAADPGKECLVQPETVVELDLRGHAEYTIRTVGELARVVQDEFGYTLQRDAPDWYNKAIEALEQGKTIYVGDFRDEGISPIETALCRYGVDRDKCDSHVDILYNEGGH